ncbi:probable serine hydrolase [Zerene cesonia]|uniref:probable serine hydrolase n=1 Tax=Zerene cesonia TaxID=33412 RepID=UPI0018E577BB|nr:probable serine hydrolase [Zerene cesonia]
MNISTKMAHRFIKPIILNSKEHGVRSILNCFNKTGCKKLHTAKNVPVKEIQIPVQWGHIAAKVWGDADRRRPILALHGWQDNAGTWDTLAPLLYQKIPIIAIDFPGHGLSSWYPHGMQYYPWDFARLILSIRDHFQWDKVSLLCHSMGSIAGMRYACVFPDDVDFYIAIDNIIADDYDLDQVVEMFPKLFRKIQITQARIDTEPPSYSIEEFVKKWHYGTKKSVSMESVHHLAKRGMKASSSDPNKYYFNRDARLKHTLFMPENKMFVETLVKRLKCPTAYFKAIDSPYASDQFSVDLRETLEKNNQNFESHFVPGTHHVHLNNPEVLAPIITKFLQKYKFI